MIELIPAALGFLGSIGRTAIDEWSRRNEHVREIESKNADRQHQIVLLQYQQDENIRIHGREMDEQSWVGMQKAMDHDASIVTESGWVNNVRALVRPAITFASIAATALSYVIYGGNAEVGVIGDVAMMSTAWWFGDRGKDMMKARTKLPDSAYIVETLKG